MKDPFSPESKHLTIGAFCSICDKPVCVGQVSIPGGHSNFDLYTMHGRAKGVKRVLFSWLGAILAYRV